MTDNPGVRIDEAHAHLLFGFVCAHKPSSVLEFGFGGGRSAEAILKAMAWNGNAACYTLVDNFCDWGGAMPEEARTFFLRHAEAHLVVCSERLFVAECRAQFDFIMSDADHTSTQLWFDDVYERLLAPGGILVYHDVRSFPNIGEIETACQKRNIPHVVFDKNSRREEACQRGLLVIFKPQE